MRMFMGNSLSAADFKVAMDKIFTELATMKGEQSCLSVAVNRLQTDKIEADGSNRDKSTSSQHLLGPGGRFPPAADLQTVFPP